MVDQKTLRGLVGDYLKNPDPVAWLAAADLYEEAGDDGKAAVWRHRVKWFPEVWGRCCTLLDVLTTSGGTHGIVMLYRPGWADSFEDYPPPVPIGDLSEADNLERLREGPVAVLFYGRGAQKTVVVSAGTPAYHPRASGNVPGLDVHHSTYVANWNRHPKDRGRYHRKRVVELCDHLREVYG